MSPGDRSGDPTLAGRIDDDELLRRATADTHEHASGQPVPHPERVSDAYADERVAAKIEAAADPRARAGLHAVDRDLKRAGVPAAWRLHLISSTVHLGRVGAETLEERLQRHSLEPPGP